MNRRFVITGARSEIAKEFRDEIDFLTLEEPAEPEFVECSISAGDSVPMNGDFYIFCHGLLHSKRFADQTEDERRRSWHMNYDSHRTIIDALVLNNPNARMCVIGSESGYRGSFDDGYAMAKMLLHDYVETKKLLTSQQQLFAISPGIIADCGMTTRRYDQDRVAARIASHRMLRAVTACEVANLAAYVLLNQPFISGTVIRMHGANR